MIDPDLIESINRRAYEIWESEGRPEGRARIHWLRAEAEFREKFCHGRPRGEQISPPRRGARTFEGLHRPMVVFRTFLFCDN
jgi:hypothetical protein